MSDSWSIAGREVEVKNLGKVFFPEHDLTKGDLLGYYRDIARCMIPHLRQRALTVERFPDGIGEQGFFQKSASDYFPGWIDRATMATEDGTIEQVVCRDAATLVYMANQGSVTFHAPLARIDLPDKPDLMIFDLDPSTDYGDDVRQTALALRDLLDELALPAFVKTTGSRGFHVVVPLERRHDFTSVRDFARAVAGRLVDRLPDLATTQQRKDKRGGRIFLDILRNAYGQTAVAPYSVRARPEAPVACPLHWRELERSDVHPRMVTIVSIARRLAQTSDPWDELMNQAVPLGDARERLARM